MLCGTKTQKEWSKMASIRKRGENSYLLVVSRGYDYQGNRLKPAQKTVHPPLGLTAKQTQKWLNEQAVLYEQEVKHTPAQPVDRSITLAKYIEIWLDQIAPKKLAASTLSRDRQDIRRILPALGHYKLTELNKEILRDFYDAMRQVRRESTGEFLAEGTVEGIHSCLCGILSDAVEAGYITHNPAWRAYKKKGISKERPVADEETVQRLIAALETQSLKYEVYYKLILATGMRRGEACGLRWSDIDWRQRALHIRRNVVKLSRQPIMVKEPKTQAGVRVVYLSKDMCKLLRAWEKECQWEKEQQGDAELTQDDYLFQQPNGDPMVPCTFTYRFKMILRENGLPDDLNVHSLRHTNASMLIAQGVDVRTVAGLLGHAQPSTTLDIYSHAFDKNKRLAGQKLSEAMGL
jgi:integrase